MIATRALALSLALAACGPATSTTPTNQQWLIGGWHGPALDERWVEVRGTMWGIALRDGGFEVNRLHGRELLAITDGRDAQTFQVTATAPERIVLGDLELAKHGRALHGSYRDVRFDLEPSPIEPAPALETANRDFFAASEKTGVDAWLAVMTPDGALWRDKRVDGAAIRPALDKTFAKGHLAWDPIASGARGDWGFTVGTYTFTPKSGAAATGSYCTIWHRVEGAWRIAFDVGD